MTFLLPEQLYWFVSNKDPLHEQYPRLKDLVEELQEAHCELLVPTHDPHDGWHREFDIKAQSKKKKT